MKWRIKENDLKTKKLLRSKRLQVNSTLFSDLKYFLVFYPNGSTSEELGDPCLLLHVQGKNEKKVEVVFDYYIKSANCSYDFQKIDCSEGYGNYCCSREDLFNPNKRFFDNEGYLTIELNGIVMLQKKQNTTKASKKLCRDIASKQANEEFTICAENKNFKVCSFYKIHRHKFAKPLGWR